MTRQDGLCFAWELKAPGKGADPTEFAEPHDIDQWQRYKMLPNLVYTDGNDWSLWHSSCTSWDRYEIRYTRTQHRPPSRQVNDRGRSVRHPRVPADGGPLPRPSDASCL